MAAALRASAAWQYSSSSSSSNVARCKCVTGRDALLQQPKVSVEQLTLGVTRIQVRYELLAAAGSTVQSTQLPVLLQVQIACSKQWQWLEYYSTA